MAELSAKYDDSSIDQLLGADRVRKRPAAVLGSSGLDGARHGFTEIYGNALDEASSGYGDKLDVTLYEDGSMSVRDYGRGVPIGWNEKRQTWNWHIIYNELYGGGKYGTNQEELQAIKDWKQFDETAFNYLYSVGLNGLGAVSTQYTSSYFIVESYRDGVCTKMRFEKGLPIFDGKPVDVFNTVQDMKLLAPYTEPTDEPNGTFIRWKPDSEVFTDVNIGGDWLHDICQDISDVAHIELHYKDEQSGVDEIIPAGDLTELLHKKFASKLIRTEDGELADVYPISNFSHGTIRVEEKPYIWVSKVSGVIGIAGKRGTEHICYHNSVKMQGGSQYQGIDMAIRDFFTEKVASRGVRITEDDYKGIFVVIISSYSNYVSFRNQTKDEVDNAFIRTLVMQTVLDKLNIEYDKGNSLVIDAVERVIREAETRQALREAEKEIREAKKAVKGKLPVKFATCRSFIKKNYNDSELWIVEGDSACGAIKLARNAEFQAVYPIRGKCLNVIKSSITKIVKNEVITDIFNLLGTGMYLEHSPDLFDISKLRFGKIIFGTDADEDGFQIRVLLFLIFFRLAPQLLLENRVFIAETPRFELHLVGGGSLYARDDAERDALLAEHGARIRSISRFKGLGEIQPATLRETTVHPDTRHLVPLTVDFDDEATKDFIEALFGSDKFHRRKEILTTALGAGVAEMLEKGDMLLEEIEDSDMDEGIEYQQVET